MDYFMTVKDCDNYTTVCEMLPFRSMLALIKKTSKKNYKDITQLYPECFVSRINSLSTADSIILVLLRYKTYTLLSIILKTYKALMGKK